MQALPQVSLKNSYLYRIQIILVGIQGRTYNFK